MKKLIRILLVTTIAVAALCCAALAVEVDPPYVENTVEGAAITLQTGYEKVDATYENDAIVSGGQYMFFMVKENASGAYIPSETSVIYMNQVTGSDGSASITGMFPSKMDDCAVMISGTGLSEPRILGYIVVPEPPYTLGDVNSDTYIDSGDAMLLKQHTAGIGNPLDETALLAGNVNGDLYTDATDAMYIMQYTASIITKFPAEA